jgi:PAT family beta-lactamase induction signal transducer AmpG
VLVLLFVLLHKIGDTLANLTFRLLFDSLGYSNDEIAAYDVGFGFWAYLAGVFLGGFLSGRLGMKRSVFVSLVLMCISNLSFAGLAAAGHSNLAMAGSIGFENVASGIGGVTVVAYFSALCDLRYTASQYALLSAAGALIEQLGYVGFYLFTTVIAVPGIVVFWLLIRWDLVGADDNATAREASESRGAKISQS